MPVSSCELRLNNEATRLDIGLELKVNLCAHISGVAVDALEIHGMLCRKCANSPTRQFRPNMSNFLLARACIQDEVPVVEEPGDHFLLMREGWMEYPWLHWGSAHASRGMWHAQTLWHHRLPQDISYCCSRCWTSCSSQTYQYAEIKAAYDFVPVEIKTPGIIHTEGMVFMDELGKRLSIAARDTREATFLYQRVFVCIQRVNAIVYRDPLWRGIWTTRGGLQKILCGFVS